MEDIQDLSLTCHGREEQTSTAAMVNEETIPEDVWVAGAKEHMYPV